MSLLHYSDFKDTGVVCIGQVPSHWQLRKLKYFARFSGGGTPNRENPAYWNGQIPWVSPKDMKLEEILETEDSITPEGLVNSTTNLVPVGQVLMVVRSGILKHTIPIAINRVPVALNQDMKALSFAPGTCLSSFFVRWVQGLNDSLLLEWSKQGATVESIEQTYLADTVVPLPPIAEQQAIATFLDRETAKIDSLIAEQEKLLILLAEKRQATISHAVTRGLDPTAPTTESDLLGPVPAHWDVRPLKYVCPKITVGIVVEPSKYYVDDGIPALRSLNVKPGKIDIDQLVYISDAANNELSKSRLRAGDLVAVRTGQPGVTAVVPPELDGCNCIDLIIMRKPTEGSEFYLCWYLSSDVAIRHFAAGSDGAIQQHFNISTAMNLIVPVPPDNEQREIAAFLERETANLDNLKLAAEHAIELLNERRTALIAAAVTGKIDVRNSVSEALAA